MTRPPETEPTDEGRGIPSDLLPDGPCNNELTAEDGDFDPETFRHLLSQADSLDAESLHSKIGHSPVDEMLFDSQAENDYSRIEGIDHVPGHPLSSASTTGRWSGQEKHPDVLHTHYPFLHLKNLSNLSVIDINVLEAGSCFRVPTRETLKGFLKQYFRHVHPLLPLIHEGEFWVRYARKDAYDTNGDGISLLLLQAMLFASCNVCEHASNAYSSY